MQIKVGVPVELSLETYQMSEVVDFHPVLLANLAVEEKHFVQVVIVGLGDLHLPVFALDLPQLLVVEVDDLIAMT